MRHTIIGERLEWIISIIIFALAGGCDSGGSQVNFSPGAQMRALTQQESADLTRVAAQEFSAGAIKDSHVDINTGFGEIDQTISLQASSKIIETIKQVERRKSTVQFTQGFDGFSTSQQFSVQEKGLLDLLIVIDNSPSIIAIQQKFGQSLTPLLKYIANTNWQIVVDTTSSACLNTTSTGKRSITRADYDKDPVATESMFRELIDVGDTGNTIEMGIRYGGDGMVGNCGNASDDWKRPGSQKATLIITDEKNCGSGSNEGCSGAPWEKAEYFINKAPANTPVYGLFLLADHFDVCPDSGGYGPTEYPAEYIRLVQMTGGKYGEVCQADYSGLLEDISAGIDNTIIQKFALDYAPVAGSIKATLDGAPLASGFTIQDHFIVMTTPIPQTAQQIVFSYLHDAVPRTNTYTLPSAPDPQTISVTVNGGLIDAQNLTFDASTNILQLKSMPPDMANVAVVYRENTALPSQFPVDNSQEILEDTITVQINGRDCSDVTFDQAKGELTFKTAPTDGSVITLGYLRPQDKVTSYKIEGIASANIEKVSFDDADTKAAIAATINDGMIIVPLDDVYEGRLVIAHYKQLFKGSALDFKVPLANTPLTGTLKVSDNSGEKVGCGEDQKLDGNNHLSFSCPDDNMTKIAVDYRYISDYTNVFKFDGALLPNASWQVTVDGKAITDYQMEDEIFTIPTDILPAGAKVVITRTPPTTP